jgi:hypothetical protein
MLPEGDRNSLIVGLGEDAAALLDWAGELGWALELELAALLLCSAGELLAVAD